MSAEQGDAHSQYNLDVAYEYGTGVPQDHATAYTWHSVSSVGGNKNYEKHRDDTAGKLTPEPLLQTQKRATELFEKYGSDK